MNISVLDQTYVAQTYNRFPVEILSGKGSVLKDSAGKEYIDLGSGIGVNTFGVADEIWLKAVQDQLNRLHHSSNLYYSEPCAKLAQLMCEKTGMKKVFFANSGAEANECAIKVARKYSAENKSPSHYTIITLKNSFHGRTLTTLSATGQEAFHQMFHPLSPGFIHVPADDENALEQAVLSVRPAGIMLEMVQGEGGVIPLSRQFAQKAQKLALEHDVPLIIDEVQTGNGRCGSLYAYQQYGLSPDIVSTAKGLGGGLPIGACMMNEKTQSVLSYGDHGSTFGGNPVCCAGAISILRRIDDTLLNQVREKEQLVVSALNDQQGIKSVSGLGLMIGIKTVKPAREVALVCIKKGVLCLTAKDKVRLLPALNIPNEQLMWAVDVIKSVCKENMV